jgi:hypothetical protein
MRKLLAAFCVTAAIGALGALLPVGASAGPATIIRLTGATWFDGNGTPVFVPDANVQIVVTNNHKGTINVRAHGTLPGGSVLPKRAMKFTDESTGFTCGGGTTSFRGVTTPSGQFSFTCKAP